MIELNNLSPDAMMAIGEILGAAEVNDTIVTLANAEGELEKAALEDEDWKHDHRFRFAFQLREIRKRFENIETQLGYEPDRD